MIQVIANGIISSSTIALVAIGFAVIYWSTGFFNFAHGVVFTIGAYSTFYFFNSLGLSLPISIIFAVILSSASGYLMDKVVYKKLRQKKSTSMVLLLASLGIYFVAQNGISILFGDSPKIIRSGIVKEGMNIFGARVTHVQALTIGISVILITMLFLLFKKSKIGFSIRAVSNNPELAMIIGVDTDRVIMWTFVIGSALAGFAGVLVALDIDMIPTMGMNALMIAMIAVIIGSVGSFSGVALASLFLGMAQHIGIWQINSQWQDTIAFIILLIFLLFNPEGFKKKIFKKMSV